MKALAQQNALIALLPERVRERWLGRMALRIRTARGPWAFLRFTGSSFGAGMVNLLKAGDITFDGWVCGPGYALILPADVFLEELPDSFLGASPQATAMARIAENGIQAAYCANHHGGSERLAKLLLQADDCFGTRQTITLSQSELGDILAIRRETIAHLLGEWSRVGIIESQRGRQVVVDRSRLEAASCDCYSVVSRFYRDETLIWKNIQWRDTGS